MHLQVLCIQQLALERVLSGCSFIKWCSLQLCLVRPARTLDISACSASLEQVAQGGCGCPIPAAIQGQAGCGSGQPGLLVGDPAHSRGLEMMSIVVLFNPGHSMIKEFLVNRYI